MKRILQIDNALRLVPYYKVNHLLKKLFAWYQDVDLVPPRRWCEKRPYSQESLEATCIPIWISMVSFLD